MTDIKLSNDRWINSWFMFPPKNLILPNDYDSEFYHLDKHHVFYKIKDMDREYLKNIIGWFDIYERNPHLDFIRLLLKKKPLTFKRLLEASQK